MTGVSTRLDESQQDTKPAYTQRVVSGLWHTIDELKVAQDARLPPGYTVSVKYNYVNTPHYYNNTAKVTVTPDRIYVFGGELQPRTALVELGNPYSVYDERHLYVDPDNVKLEKAVRLLALHIQDDIRRRGNEEVEFMYGKLKDAVEKGLIIPDEIPLRNIPVGNHEFPELMETAQGNAILPQNVGDFRENPMALFCYPLVGLQEYERIVKRLYNDFGIQIPHSMRLDLDSLARKSNANEKKRRRVYIGFASHYEVDVG
ncbi:MAG: hypothetical protein HYW22_02180 [Candidatus Aenigmarchaeota archaeon]|nr:hypothetical protein [Candidatus Aenigmarchaeota archaeon]